MTESRRKLIAAAFGLDRAPGRAGNMSVATESGCKRRSFAHWTKLSIWKRLTLVSLLFFLVPDAAQAAIQFRAATKQVAETSSLTASKPACTTDGIFLLRLPSMTLPRRDLNNRWDVGIHGDVLRSWESDVSTVGWGVDVGVTLFENVWVSVGYNFAGFRDDDFASSNCTAQGPFITFRIKADQDTFRKLASGGDLPRHGQEDGR